MATTLTIARSFGWTGTYDNSGDTGQPGAKMPIAVSETQDYTDGTSDNQGDVIVFKRGSAAAGVVTIDLTSDLADLYGNTVALAKVRGIWLTNESTTSGELLTLGGNVMAAFCGVNTYTVIVHPGPGHWIQEAPVDGYTITNTTQDQFTINPGANTIAYTLRILGVLS